MITITNDAPPAPATPASGEVATPWKGGRFDGRPRPPRLLFGHTFEDPAIEDELFPPGGRVLCIAAAGDTARWLAAGGRTVIAVDINPAQVAEVRRRLAGARPRRGTADRLLSFGRLVLWSLGWGRRARRRCLDAGDAAERTVAWRQLTPRSVRAVVRLALHPRVLRLAFGADFASFVPRRFGDVVLDRIGDRLALGPDVGTPWLSLLLRGRMGIACPVSRRSGGRALGLAGGWTDRRSVGRTGGWADRRTDDGRTDGRSSSRGAATHAGREVGRIDLRTGDVADVLDSLPPGSLDGVSLSNVLDGPGPEYAARLLAAARRAARPGAPIVVRSLLDPPADEDPIHVAARRLADRDRSLLWGAITVHHADPEVPS